MPAMFLIAVLLAAPWQLSVEQLQDGKAIPLYGDAAGHGATALRVRIEGPPGAAVLRVADSKPRSLKLKSATLDVKLRMSPVTLDLPIAAKRPGRIALRLLGAGQKLLASASVVVSGQAEPKWTDDEGISLALDDGTPVIAAQQPNTLNPPGFFISIAKVPESVPPCVMALESVDDGGRILSQLIVRLGPPSFREGPFFSIHAYPTLAPEEIVRPHDNFYGAIRGNPLVEPAWPPPRTTRQLITAYSLSLREISCP